MNDQNETTATGAQTTTAESVDLQRMGMRWEDDAERWGNALNEAAWKYMEAYSEVTGEAVSGKHWNNAKTILRTAILAYAAEVAKAHTHRICED